jgi:hypothetical protein
MKSLESFAFYSVYFALPSSSDVLEKGGSFSLGIIRLKSE